MRSVKITIDGAYWDSQIYSGELTIFDENGAMHRIEWRDAIDELATQNQDVQTAIRVAFSDSDLFYNPKVRKILCDPHIESPIKKQLNNLSNLNLVAGFFDFKKYWKTEQTPFNFLPTDTEIYYNNIIACGNEGLFSSRRRGTESRTYSRNNKAIKHHDGKMLQIRASDRFTSIAAAGGGDGLFEFPFRKDEEDVLDSAIWLAKRPCSSCDWAFQSVMGWTSESGFLASFRQNKEPNSNKKTRSFDRIIDQKEMFNQSTNQDGQYGLTWGCREKIYRISDDGIEVTNYSPDAFLRKSKGKPAQISSRQFSLHGSVKLDFDGSKAIATGTAPFGTVLEFEDRIIVIRSDGQIERFDGEAVHWRVFPRSEHYSNQLHIIYDDRLEIISFVHDYFVNQESKLSGFKRGGHDYMFSEQ